MNEFTSMYEVLPYSVPVCKILSIYPGYRLVDPQEPQCGKPRKVKTETISFDWERMKFCFSEPEGGYK